MASLSVTCPHTVSGVIFVIPADIDDQVFSNPYLVICGFIDADGSTNVDLTVLSNSHNTPTMVIDPSGGDRSEVVSRSKYNITCGRDRH